MRNVQPSRIDLSARAVLASKTKQAIYLEQNRSKIWRKVWPVTRNAENEIRFPKKHIVRTIIS